MTERKREWKREMERESEAPLHHFKRLRLCGSCNRKSLKIMLCCCRCCWCVTLFTNSPPLTPHALFGIRSHSRSALTLTLFRSLPTSYSVWHYLQFNAVTHVKHRVENVFLCFPSSPSSTCFFSCHLKYFIILLVFKLHFDLLLLNLINCYLTCFSSVSVAVAVDVASALPTAVSASTSLLALPSPC